MRAGTLLINAGGQSKKLERKYLATCTTGLNNTCCYDVAAIIIVLKTASFFHLLHKNFHFFL